MKARFVAISFATALINLVLHAGTFFIFLKDFYAAYPAGSAAYLQQLNRPANELVIWALLLSSVAFGFLITTAIKWSGARTFGSGLKKGLVLGLLFWTAINFGLYSAQNIFSLPGVFADLVCSVLAMTISAAASAWMLGKMKLPILTKPG
jgi:hypothetical protein